MDRYRKSAANILLTLSLLVRGEEGQAKHEGAKN